MNGPQSAGLAEKPALLAAIAAAPDDDLPRLVYADWLERRNSAADRAQAEFIRVQCQLAQLEADQPAYPKLKERETELLARHRRSWLGPLWEQERRWADLRPNLFQFHRGLVGGVLLQGPGPCSKDSQVSKDSQDWLQHAPLLRRVGFTTDAIDWLSRDWPGLTQIDSLHALTHVPVSRLNVLLQAPRLGRLRAFSLDEQFSATDSRVIPDALANHGHLRELSISAHFSQMAPLAARDFLRLPGLRLSTVTISCNGASPGDRLLETLAEAPLAEGLQSLKLDCSQIGPETFRRLVQSPLLIALRDLRLTAGTLLPLHSRQLGLGNLRGFLQTPEISQVESLEFYACQLGSKSAQAIAESPYLTKLRKLRLGGNPRLGNKGAMAIVESGNLPQLEFVNLRGVSLSASVRDRLLERFGSDGLCL